jgi:putative ABC transport system substrate-binding protein
VARAQQQTVPTIGFLSSRSLEDSKPHLEGFLRGLAVCRRQNSKDRISLGQWAVRSIEEIGRRTGCATPCHYCGGRRGTFRSSGKVRHDIHSHHFHRGDSVSEGIVASLNQPGANVTGVDLMSGELTGKRLSLLAQLLPSGTPIGFLTNKKGVQSSLHASDFELAVAAMNREPVVVGASDDAEIDNSFSLLNQKRVGGLVVENDPFFDSRRERLIRLTAQQSIPAIYHIREFPLAGGLMSYGTNLMDAYYQMGVLIGRILKGANIADLPVTRPTKFDLALNLSTAKVLGLTIPTTVLAIADELKIKTRRPLRTRVMSHRQLTGLLGSAGVIVMLLSGTAFAQSMRPGINLTPGNRPLSPEEQARQKAVDDAYRSAIEKLPDKKKSADPWDSIRPAPSSRKRQDKQ